ncbi:glycosyltransferase family 4 protein [bacterium]|jgi:glycosyltransferase involved in cell wall biosynthesis|nr:glycosyltransferase family 4 protein [bacterium]
MSNSTLRELVVCLSHSWGGLEHVSAQDALDHASAGMDVEVLCYKGSPIHEFLKKQPAGEKIRFHTIGFEPYNHFDYRLRRILKAKVKSGTNIVHCHQPSVLGSVVPWLMFEKKVALFSTRHIMSGHNKKDPYHRYIYSRLNALFVMSESLRENVLKTHPIDPLKVKVLRLGLDLEKFDSKKVDAEELRQKWGADSKTVLVGLVGRLDPAKGQETFLRAASVLRKNPAKKNLRFILVGEETRSRDVSAKGYSYRTHLENLVNELELSSSVVFAGYQKDIPQVMKALDICVMPSREETFGLVAIEAMAMGKPVIVSKGGSSLEIVGEKEDHGILVEPEDPEDLSQKISMLVQSSEMASDLAKKGRDFVQREYDRKKRTALTLENYKAALS